MIKRTIHIFSFSYILCVLILFFQTHRDLQTIPETLNVSGSTVQKPQLLDRHLKPITITYKNYWNLHDFVPLYEIPEFLKHAFIVSEDKRFYDHHGVDWTARLHALWQNISAMRNVRGASTISEQTIKMLHPRPRTIWTRWLEGFEAAQLEKRFSKNEILEFYLNQVPYSAQRRGVTQAARYYFDRDLATLNHQEMMTLAVLVRAPSRLDPIKNPDAVKPAVERLAELMNEPINWSNTISAKELNSIKASHFASYVYKKNNQELKSNIHKIKTTLDQNIQNITQQILEQRILDLKNSNVQNGAVLIVDHKNNEILSWVVAGDSQAEYPGNGIDAVTTPRQPGSTLKPLLYTLALEKGFTAATLIHDSPLSESVGFGQHTYRNYSRQHYGLISVREALGNSLNIPAVKTLQKVGTENFLNLLHKLGISSLQKHPDLYGDGLALGNGEITLYELVQAYSTLPRQGNYKSLSINRDQYLDHKSKKIFTSESTSLIANILSDPKARRREFGSGGLLNFPIQTAVKTGTSNDYRDAWAIGFDYNYTVGIWMGNMDRTSMKEITGSIGPAFVLRSVFAELNKHKKSQALYFSPKLVKAKLCTETGLPRTSGQEKCTQINEWFIPGSVPEHKVKPVVKKDHKIRIQQPTPNLQIAMDPRIPDHKEKFIFSLNNPDQNQQVKWILNGQLLAETSSSEFHWKIEKGAHRLQAELLNNDQLIKTRSVNFLVK
ncbi:MAG: transglycosylase domain-containing protein [Gammaproteobacteria bacterium]